MHDLVYTEMLLYFSMSLMDRQYLSIDFKAYVLSLHYVLCLFYINSELIHEYRWMLLHIYKAYHLQTFSISIFQNIQVNCRLLVTFCSLATMLHCAGSAGNLERIRCHVLVLKWGQSLDGVCVCLTVFACFQQLLYYLMWPYWRDSSALLVCQHGAIAPQQIQAGARVESRADGTSRFMAGNGDLAWTRLPYARDNGCQCWPVCQPCSSAPITKAAAEALPLCRQLQTVAGSSKAPSHTPQHNKEPINAFPLFKQKITSYVLRHTKCMRHK